MSTQSFLINTNYALKGILEISKEIFNKIVEMVNLDSLGLKCSRED